MSASMKEQMQAVVASGALTTRKVVKTLKPKTKPGAQQVTTKSVAPKEWWQQQVATVETAKVGANRLQVLKSLNSPELGERLTDLENLVTQIQSKCAEQSKEGGRNVVAARREAETAINYVRTVRAAAKTRDIEVAHLPEISKQMGQYLASLKESLQKIGEGKVENAKIEVIDRDAVAHYKQSELRFTRTAQENIKNPAFMVDLPIVPIFDGIVTPEHLFQAGLPVEKMGGYPVLLRQRLIALKTEMLENAGLDKHVYMKKLIRRLEEHSPQEWTLVTDTGHPSAKHEVFLYWIMPSRVLNAMTKAASGNPLREWGLAF